MKKDSDRSRHAWACRLALACVFCLFEAGSAFAHGGDSDGEQEVRAVIDPLPPELDGLRVQLRHTLAAQLLVTNPTDKPLGVLDERGRTFVRIGNGHVEGDLGAASFHRTYTLMAPGAIKADASSDPNWQTVEDTPNWGWFDLRLRGSDVAVPHAVIDAGQPADVGSWSIPVHYGEVDSAITGHFEFVPPTRGIIEAQVTDSGALSGQALVRAMTGSAKPGLFVSYRGDKPLTVFDDQGGPLLRFSAQGVEVNQLSRTWADIRPSGAPEHVTAAGNTASVRWAKLSSGKSYGWIEPRAAYAGTPEDAATAHVVKQWQIPIRIGDADSTIQGETAWAPIQPLASNH